MSEPETRRPKPCPAKLAAALKVAPRRSGCCLFGYLHFLSFTLYLIEAPNYLQGHEYWAGAEHERQLPRLAELKLQACVNTKSDLLCSKYPWRPPIHPLPTSPNVRAGSKT